MKTNINGGARHALIYQKRFASANSKMSQCESINSETTATTQSVSASCWQCQTSLNYPELSECNYNHGYLNKPSGQKYGQKEDIIGIISPSQGVHKLGEE